VEYGRLFWDKMLVNSGDLLGKDNAAKFLKNSLNDKPNDIEIIDGDIIQKIKSSQEFKTKINRVLEKYANETKINILITGDNNKDESFTLSEDLDLKLSLNRVKLGIDGFKNDNGAWDLDITLQDGYNYKIEETEETDSLKQKMIIMLNNFAAKSAKQGIINFYDITIKFRLENYEVIK
jgi:hypothetical protein